MTGPRDLCLIGVAQRTSREVPAVEPLLSWEQVARTAVEDTGCPDLLAQLESVQVVYCQTWPYDAPVDRLCELLGTSPRHRLYSGIGGTTPQLLVQRTAEAMARGELDLALVVSGEALATLRAAKRAGERLPWSHRLSTPYPWEPPHPTEVDHAVFQAWETFPLWDTARRARLGVPLEQYAGDTARMMAALSVTAAANEHAWQPHAWTADEVGTASPANRYVGWPYTRREVAVMDVDMSAALVLATRERADRLGIPEERRVHLRSSATASDPAPVAARPDPSRSPALAAATGAALTAAGLDVDELAHLDLYSCFPSSLHLACDALGIASDDARGLTVTGGLPYAGGPASGYLVHALASTADRIRSSGGAALVTGVGMHLRDHVAAVWSAEPGFTSVEPVPEPPPAVPVVRAHTGPARVVAYTVAHGRDGLPGEGLLVLDVPGGRTLARVTGQEQLHDAVSRELVGATVSVSHDGTRNEATW